MEGRGEGVRHEIRDQLPERPEVHLDFFFVGDEGRDERRAVLAARERVTRMTMSAVAPTKGGKDKQFLAKRVQALLRDIGRLWATLR